MIVLSEASDQLKPSPSARELIVSTDAARLMGCRVYYIPQDFSVCETAENAFIYVPEQDEPALAIWIGYIPTAERYEAIYNAALQKNIRLLNNPEEHLRAQEFDRAYPLLKGLTPETISVTSIDQCDEAAKQLGFPVFIKGAVQSLKAHGPEACVANNVEELKNLTKTFLRITERSRGRVLIRRFINLRHVRKSGQGFPLGREYRVFLYLGEVMGIGYYWEGKDELKELSLDEKAKIFALAAEANNRVNVPFLALDIGQTEDGEWIVIETGDPQFAGISEIPLLPLWSKISEIG